MSDYVSTGHLPPSDQVDAWVAEAYEKFKTYTGGRNSDVYPALAAVPRELFGICVVGVKGNVHSAGTAEHEF